MHAFLHNRERGSRLVGMTASSDVKEPEAGSASGSFLYTFLQLTMIETRIKSTQLDQVIV